MTMPIEWIPSKPADFDDWERVIRETAGGAHGTGAVRLRQTTSGWFIEAARKTGGEPPLDMRWHLTEALRKAGKQVVGVTMLQGEPPLSAEREAAIRSALEQPWEPPGLPAMSYDTQVVSDLLGEIDRLRAKLHLASHARDLAGEASTKLLSACDGIVPRPSRSFDRTRQPKPRPQGSNG
jgi:hypothetical protein